MSRMVLGLKASSVDHSAYPRPRYQADWNIAEELAGRYVLFNRVWVKNRALLVADQFTPARVHLDSLIASIDTVLDQQIGKRREINSAAPVLERSQSSFDPHGEFQNDARAVQQLLEEPGYGPNNLVARELWQSLESPYCFDELIAQYKRYLGRLSHLVDRLYSPVRFAALQHECDVHSYEGGSLLRQSKDIKNELPLIYSIVGDIGVKRGIEALELFSAQIHNIDRIFHLLTLGAAQIRRTIEALCGVVFGSSDVQMNVNARQAVVEVLDCFEDERGLRAYSRPPAAIL